MAEEGTPTGKTLTDVVDQLETLNAELDQQGENARRSGAQVVKSGKLRGVLAFFHRRGAKKRDVKRGKDLAALQSATISEFKETETRHDDFEKQAEQIGKQTDQLDEVTANQEGSTEMLHGEMTRQTENLDKIKGHAEDQVGNQLHHIDLVESGNEDLAKLSKDTEDTGGFLGDLAGETESLKTSFNEMLSSQNETTSLLGSMFDLQMKDSASMAEAAREAARGGKDEGGGVPDAKAEEAKAGGFFSRMGKAVMNPIGKLGKGMKSAGKGIGGFLKGLASGLAAFANPMVVLGVAAIAVSLPIFAAGLAAAFKVFELIIGEGSALKMITGIILSLGEAIGTILHKVLTGFGNMIKNMGPFIKDFFTGIATVVKALTPILTALFTVIKDIITDPVLNVTIQTVLATVQVALQTIGTIVETVGNVIVTVLTKTEGILNSIFNGISLVIKTIGDAITGIIDKIVEGIERLAVLPAGNMLAVAGALGVLPIALVGFSVGAAIAGGVMPSAEDLDKIAGSVKTFGDIEAGNLALVGDGMKKVGIGLLAFGGGGAIADLLMPTNSAGMEAVAKSVQMFGTIDGSNFAVVGDGIKKLGIGLAAFGGGGAVSALGDAFSSWVGGGKDPVDKFRAFAEIGPGLKDAGDGVSALAASFDAFNTDNLERIGNGLDKFLGATDMDKLKAFSQATEGLMTGQMLAQLQVDSNKAGGGTTTIIQNTSTNQVNSSQPVVLPASGVNPSNGDIMNVRIVT